MTADEPSLITLSGPVLVAYFISFGLYGVLAAQVYAYYVCFPKDKYHVKTLVYGVLAIETAQTILVTCDAVTMFGTGFGHESNLVKIHNEWLTMPITSGLTGCIVQCFYAYRIKILTHTITTSCFVVLFALVQCIGAIVAGVEGHIINDAWRLNTRVEFVAQVVRNATSATCDIIIAGYICYYLYQSRTKVENSQGRLTRIIKLIIGTGVFTALIAIIDLILYLAAYKHGAYFFIPCLCLGKLYSNSMMVVLNNRANIVLGRGRDEFGDTVTREASFDIGGDTTVDTSSSGGERGPETRVQFDVEGQK